MSVLSWNIPGHKKFETGVSKGVLFVVDSVAGTYRSGVAWIGLQNIDENPTGADSNKLYADNTVYGNLRSAEEFEGSIGAYQYPDEFEECDGSKEVAPGVTIGQQPRSTFGLAYRTEIGNELNSNAGYKIHLVYGASIPPSQKSYETVNDSPEAISFSWDFETTPVEVTAVEGAKPTATIVIDSTKVDKQKLAAFEKILYGTESEESRLPMPDEVYTHFKAA